MKHKKLTIVLVAIISIIVCLSIFIMIWFWGDVYEDFSDFSESAEIPGLDDGAVPQGIGNYKTSYVTADQSGNAANASQQYLLISAYMKSGPSRIYVTGVRSGYVGYVTLKNTDGSDYTGHCGGIATNCVSGNPNGSVWIVSDNTVYVIRRTQENKQDNSFGDLNIAEEIVKRAQLGDGQNVMQFSASFDANCNASFCYFYDDPSGTSNDRLYVGEFYREGNYETDTLHHVTTKSGAQNRAFVYEYSIDTNSSNKYGLNLITSSQVAQENKVPKINYIYSIPDKIQGFARLTGTSGNSGTGKLVLSESWGLSNSKLYYYDWSKIYTSTNRESYSALNENKQSFAYKGVFYDQGVQYTDPSLYVYFIDDSALVREYSIPCMSEGLCAAGDRIYVLFESGSYKYSKFVRQQLKNVYSFVPRQ